MNGCEKIPGAFLCGLLVFSVMISGCTSSDGSGPGPESGSGEGPYSGYAGTYTNTDDAATKFILDADGKFDHTNGVSRYSGTWSVVEGQFRFCTEDKDSTECFTVPIESDGSFTYGYNTFTR